MFFNNASDIRHLQIFSLVADNASNNNTLVDELEVLLPSFGGQQARVRCFAHILNLVVKVRLCSYNPCPGRY